MSELSIKWPDIRNEIVQSLKWLTDKNIEQWCDPAYPHPFWDSLRYPIGNLLDDLDMHENPETQIGALLYDSQEAEAIKKAATYLSKLVVEVGGKQPDRAYLDWPLWNEMVSAAGEALKILKANNYKYDFIHKDL